MTQRLRDSFAAIMMTLVSLSGVFVEAADAPAPARNTPESVRKYWLLPPPAGDGVVERGEWLFRQKGCFLCHGPAGQGGVPNHNYIRETVPRLSPAELMKLEETEDVLAILEHLTRRQPLDSLVDAPPVPRYEVVLGQYHSIQSLIQTGRKPGKKNAKGPVPPLKMPSWRRELSAADIDAIIAYLLHTRHQEESRATAENAASAP